MQSTALSVDKTFVPVCFEDMNLTFLGQELGCRVLRLALEIRRHSSHSRSCYDGDVVVELIAEETA